MSDKEFRLRRFIVSVDGYGPSEYLATSRGKALAAAWSCDAFSGYTYGQFLRIARCRLSENQPEPVRCTVNSKPAFYVGRDRQYCHIVWPGADFVSNAHPYEVLPIDLRPEGYRDRVAT